VKYMERIRSTIVAIFLGLSLLQTLFHSVVEYKVDTHLANHEVEHAGADDTRHDGGSHEKHLDELEDWHGLLR